MKIWYTLSLAILFCTPAFAQKAEKLGAKDKAATEHFQNSYKKKNYKKFDGKIIPGSNEVRFDDKVVYYDTSDKTTALLLKEGLIYPQLLTDYQMQKFIDETTDRTQKRFLKLQKDPRAGFDVNQVKLGPTTEAGFLKTGPQVRRFKMICKDSRFPNSIIYFIELTNKSATDATPTQQFIKEAKLTHIYQQE